MRSAYCYLLFLFLFFITSNVNCAGKAKNKRKNRQTSLYFYNELDNADAESYGATLFNYLFTHMNEIKIQAERCRSIPLPKTILNKKYFNPNYDLQQFKYWYPPKDHNYIVVWSQYESYRQAMFMSQLLQNENANFPPGILKIYIKETNKQLT